MINKKSIKIEILSWLVLLIFLFNSCCFKLTKHLKEKNPLKYTFSVQIKDLKDSIYIALGNRVYRGMYMKSAPDALLLNRELMSKTENRNDFYLYSYEFIGKSSMYYSWWGNLKLSAEFQIHLDSIGENYTSVTIYTFREEVSTGIRPGLGDNTLLVMCTKDVVPSTYEEYELLLIIGKKIGEKNMPPIRKPTIF